MLKQILRFVLFLGIAHSALADLPNDAAGKVETLPVPYSNDWVIVHDIAFDHMSIGRFMVMDINGGDIKDYFKGSFNGGFIAAFTQALKKPEMYVLEHYYDRGTRGNRTDVLTIYDRATLLPVDEIILDDPKLKRAEILVSKFVISLIDNERFLLFYSFTPGTFVTVVDLEKREVVNGVPLPTCAGIFPTGERGFSSLCGNGSMVSFQLDEDGQVTEQGKIEPFFDVDEDALFERPAIIGSTGYFPSFSGAVQEIDLSGSAAVLGEKWNLLNEEDREQNWRPGGAWLTATDSTGRLYVMMHPDGGEGSHDNPGSEIWVFDTASKTRVQRIALTLPAIAFDITMGDAPKIVTTNIEMNLEVYDARSGGHLNTIADFYHNWPLLVYASQ
ncbi:MAG: amine dehydrogenase large subunit [Gammaproteobacteria bacterium]|nr:amine dehydrogenase large subunit [Gammaproteobacteria bacterium]